MKLTKTILGLSCAVIVGFGAINTVQAEEFKDSRLYQLVQEAKQAKANGDTARVAELRQEIAKTWRALPASKKVKYRKHAATIRRAGTLTSTTTKTEDGRETTGTVTNKKGEVVRTYESSSSRDGNVSNHERTVTNKDGEVVRTNDTTITRGEGERDRETVITKKDGSTVTIDAHHEKTSNGIETTKTVTNSEGKTKTLEATTTRDGNTATRTGTWTNGKGETIRKRRTDTVRTQDGKTTRTNVAKANGKTRTTVTNTKKKGNSLVTRGKTSSSKAKAKKSSGKKRK